MRSEKAQWLEREPTSVIAAHEMTPERRAKVERSMAIESYIKAYGQFGFAKTYFKDMKNKFPEKNVQREAMQKDEDKLEKRLKTLSVLMTYILKEDIIPNYQELLDMSLEELQSLGEPLERKLDVQGEDIHARLLMIWTGGIRVRDAIVKFDVDARLEENAERRRTRKKAVNE